MRARFRGLWRHPDFLKVWCGQTISAFGSQITLLALPLAAALTLDATPGEMGLLAAAGRLPSLLFGLFAGVWVDRYRRRPILIAANLGRAALIATIPLALALDVLRIELLYVVEFCTGTLTVVAGVAHVSYLPSLVSRENLVEANSKLQVSQSAAVAAGPGMAGTLVQVLTAPVAIVLDALSFLVSAACLLLVRKREPEPAPSRARRNVRAEIGEGLRLVLQNPILRPIAAWAGTFNTLGSIGSAVYILFATRTLGLGPGTIGFIYSVGLTSALISALFVQRITAWLGVGRALITGAMVLNVSQVLVPLAGGPTPVAVVMLTASWLIFGLANPVLNVNILSLQQAATPDRLLGRVNATMSVLIIGTVPIGSLIGGVLGSLIGLRPTLIVGALGMCASTLWIWFSPVRRMERTPAAAPATPVRAEAP